MVLIFCVTYIISPSSSGLYTPSLAPRSIVPDSRHRKPCRRPTSCLAIPFHPCDYYHSRVSCFDVVRDKTNYSSTFRTWRRMRDGVLQTLEIQSLPNPEGCFGISPCFADIYRCKATENFNFFLQKNLKMFWHWLPPNRV